MQNKVNDRRFPNLSVHAYKQNKSGTHVLSDLIAPVKHAHDKGQVLLSHLIGQAGTCMDKM